MTTSEAGAGASASALRLLPVGGVRPRGWLADQLRLQAEGLTGSLEDIWPDVGPDSAWLGGNGEDWERGPYYLDGLVPLAHVLDDSGLIAKAARWTEAILASQRPDGWFGPATNDDWWPRMVALKALTQHAEATGDNRVEPFLGAYFRHQLAALPGRPLHDWGRVRGADNALTVAWLWERTGEPWLRDLSRLLLQQSADWDGFLTAFPCRDVTRSWDHMTHIVNVAMGLKTPAVRDLFEPEERNRRVTAAAFDNLDRFHGQVHGMFSGDEWLAGRDATRGVELCGIVELMFSLQQMIRVWGDARHADRLEGLAYNLLPAALTADMTAHQYHQQANQVLVTIAQRDWTQADDDCTIFGLEPNFGCCTANFHQGWPKLLQSMWMTTSAGGLAAVVHGPSVVRWTRPAGTVRIEATTAYPFDETIRYEVRDASGGPFKLRLRVPGWCVGATVQVNGEAGREQLDGDWLTIERTWSPGDVVELRLPMAPRLLPRPRGATGIALGPIVLAYSPGEVWERLPGSTAFGDWEVRPRRSWNVAVATEGLPGQADVRVERITPGRIPFGLRTGSAPFGIDGVPLKVWIPARRAEGWELARNSAAPPPPGPVDGQAFDRSIPLVPYGCARIRVAEFPTAQPVAASAS